MRRVLIVAAVSLSAMLQQSSPASAAGLNVDLAPDAQASYIAVCASATPTGPIPVLATVTLTMAGSETYYGSLSLPDATSTYEGPLVGTYPGAGQPGLGVSTATSSSSATASTCQTFYLHADSTATVTFHAVYAGFDGAGSVSVCDGQAERIGYPALFPPTRWFITNPCRGQIL